MYLFFDTETTGLPEDWDAPVSDVNNWPRLVQLAFSLYDQYGKLIESHDFIVKPVGYVIPQEAAEVHGITHKTALEDGLDMSEVLATFQAQLPKCTHLVAHNMDYDEKILGAEFYRLTKKDPLASKQKICTMKTKAIIDFYKIPSPYGKYKWPKLTELHYKLFREEFDYAHDASVDVEATVRCFFELRDRGVI